MKRKFWMVVLLGCLTVPAVAQQAVAQQAGAQQATAQQSIAADTTWLPTLITDTPQQGFDLAITLSRTGVRMTQPDVRVLREGREDYMDDADSLIAASQVIAIHFQTIAAANNYWRND